MKPASRTQRAKRATCGLMPGISVMTITAGPRARDVDPLGDAVERDLAALEVLERIVLLHAARSAPWPWHASRSGVHN